MKLVSALLGMVLVCSACGANVVVDDGNAGGSGGDGGPGGAPTTPSSSTLSSTATVSTGTGIIPTDVLEQLEQIPGLDVEEWTSDYPGYRSFIGSFQQPADHGVPDGLQFEQRIRILHRDSASPTVLFSTGYGLVDYDYLSEPALLIDGNQIAVEHRFFVPSRPEPADWQLLTIEQSANDYHRLVSALKPVYGARWLSTGGSKGGMTSVYFRRFFPDDVDGTVAYVAPLSHGIDPRYVAFLDQVGDPACRDDLKDFQVDALSRRATLIDLVFQTGGNFGYWDEDAALDFAVEALRFLIWQYADASACDWIPDVDASDGEVFDYLQSYSPVEGSGDEILDYYEPYYFQAAIELGEPAADESYMASLLSVPVGLSAADFVQPGPTKDTTFRPAVMLDIQDWVTIAGSELLFINGQNDPWNAAAFHVSGELDTIELVAPLGNHGSGIYSLELQDQGIAENAVLRWAGLVDSPPPRPSPVHLELARLGRLADSLPPGKLRARFELSARALLGELRRGR